MRIIRTSVSCLAMIAGLAAISLPVSGSAIAAKGCHDNGQPVCAVNAGGRTTYNSACAAKSDSARILHGGGCLSALCYVTMTVDQRSVCGTDPLNHKRMTYPNNCALEAANASVVHDGPCRDGR
jgi:hypothetical protein